jgi:hypothetical protein
MTTAIALLAVIPMQLAAAAGVELAGGYDSTVLDQRTLFFGDGVISRAAVDLQFGHRTETFRQLLRTRGEFYFTSGEGRDVSQSDLVSLTRYSLRWDSDDDRWGLEGSASYVLGRTSLLLGRTSSPDLVFQRGLYGELNGHLDLTRQFGERTRLTLSALALDRHAVDIPLGAARNNLTSIAGVATLAHDVGEKDTLEISGRGEGFSIDGVADWVARVTAYGGWRRRWNENLATFILGGVDMLQDQNDRTDFLTGPYAHVGLGWAEPEDGVALSFDARYEYAIVAATRCNIAVPRGLPCPPTQVAAGGVGRVAGTAFNFLFRPNHSAWVLTAGLQGDYGVTQNYDQRPGAPPNTIRDIENINFNAGAGLRWSPSRRFGMFVRYDFFWSYLTAGVPGAISEFVRHVAMLGVAVSTSVGEGPSEPLVAFEELDAFAAVRAAGAGREAAERTSTRTRDPYDDDDSAGGDPMGDRPSEEQINAEIQRQFEAQRAPRSANDLARPDGSPPRNGNVTPTNVNTPPSGSRVTQPSTGAPREGANSPDAPSQEAPR